MLKRVEDLEDGALGKKLLAWHGTLELHKLVAFQFVGLMKFKMSLNIITDAELKEI
ncbi:hypothetical protein KW850_10770 [Bacillus sp. sid0103]|uniref:hypothetical protein n=1 Tax=Bacillus sp. sid0103 TaxID=2856337 RepID=UPI001C47E1A8|nr:hypothetical protein [Bacillus sp. sid0103]MBV7505736.1 hypothetical protein [Bacillus sp. sid0103]